MKAAKRKPLEDEIGTINKRLEELRAERHRLKAEGAPYDDIDREVRIGVRRLKRINAKLAPRSKTGTSIKVIGSSSSSNGKFITYKDASKRPLRGGSVSPK